MLVYYKYLFFLSFLNVLVDQRTSGICNYQRLADRHSWKISGLAFSGLQNKLADQRLADSKKNQRCPPLLVSALSEIRHLFQLFCYNFKTGSFSVSKQPKQTKDRLNQQQNYQNINQIPHTINSVCFGCFDTRPKHQNKPKQTETIFWGFAKQTKKQPKQIRFPFVSVQTKKKLIL